MVNGEKKLFYEECQESCYYDEKQLEEIYNGLVCLSLEQVEIFAKESYNDGQMKQIRVGLETLPIEQVMIYAKECFDADQMWEIRMGLETLSVSDVMKYANPAISRFSMSGYRMNLQNKLFIKLFEIDPTFLIPSQVCESLRAVKKLPFDKVQDIIDFKDSVRAMEIKRVNAELVYYGQLKKYHEPLNGNINSVEMSSILNMLDGLSSEELEIITNHINLKLENDILEGKSLVKSKTKI